MEVYKKPRVRISVEGYDTTLPEEDIKKALVDLLESCGEIIRVTVPIDPRTRLVESEALIYFTQEEAEGKALKLSGRIESNCSPHSDSGKKSFPFPCLRTCHIVFLTEEINKKIMAFKKKNKGLV